jgi:hypothetical protein
MIGFLEGKAAMVPGIALVSYIQRPRPMRETRMVRKLPENLAKKKDSRIRRQERNGSKIRTVEELDGRMPKGKFGYPPGMAVQHTEALIGMFKTLVQAGTLMYIPAEGRDE